LIALRLPIDMHSKLLQLAAAESRTPSNFIEHHLRRLLDGKLRPVFTLEEEADVRRHVAPRQVDLAEAIASAVKRGPQTKPRRPK
jgi:hypothetical protein